MDFAASLTSGSGSLFPSLENLVAASAHDRAHLPKQDQLVPTLAFPESIRTKVLQWFTVRVDGADPETRKGGEGAAML